MSRKRRKSKTLINPSTGERQSRREYRRNKREMRQIMKEADREA